MSLFAKKSLGQNFLTSPAIAKKIVDIAGVGQMNTPKTIVEIGPGTGMLTEHILNALHSNDGVLIAIEKDHRSIPLLHERFEKEIMNKKLIVIEKDITEWSPYENGLLEYSVVANIPYYITGEIMRLFLSSAIKPKSMTLMVQKEVADRIVARDGKESILSISVKAFGKPHYAMTVKPGSFNPAPSVDSAVLHISDISNALFEQDNIHTHASALMEQCFFEIVKTGFAHKRKRLIANIAPLFGEGAMGKLKATEYAHACGIATNERAENITLEQWLFLAKQIKIIDNTFKD